jgi:hypothetical protein
MNNSLQPANNTQRHRMHMYISPYMLFYVMQHRRHAAREESLAPCVRLAHTHKELIRSALTLLVILLVSLVLYCIMH